MSEIKYEAVFGDQSLFDGAPEDAEYAGWFCQEVRWYMILNGKILFSDGGSWCTSDNPYLSADIAAMRRVIKTPVISGDIDDLIKDEFSEWWEKEGCLVRSGGGDRERTFAFAAFRKLMPEILAARGLKKTPVWTVADQKAGRLPEVGAKYIGKNENNSARELICDFVDDDECIWGHDKNNRIFGFFRLNIKPIETPAEKSQRLEDEFVKSEMKDTTLSIEWACIYERGVRAAYRKLSGELAAHKGGDKA